MKRGTDQLDLAYDGCLVGAGRSLMWNLILEPM